MADVVLRGSFDRDHERRYAHVPFEVPAGVRALHVSYDYSDRIPSDPLLSGGNTLDIGLFDPRGIEASSPGFRGWSGSSQLDFWLGETGATPPYVAGPIQPGRWHVLLGPYKVGPRGCSYQVEITFADQPPTPEPRPTQVHARPPRLAAAAEPGWLRGDLHCHTLHSDGDSWPAEMLDAAIAAGLEFLGVTDHNQTSHQADYAQVTGEHLPIVLPGIEVTTYRGHWNAWGTPTWWEFREPTEPATSRAMQAAAASGAIVSVNHPKPYGPPWEYPNAVGYHAIEVWNGEWLELNQVALAWWEQHLRAGRRIVALGGSDTHHLKRPDPSRLGSPTTWVKVGDDRSTVAVLDGLRSGQVFISRGPEGPQLYLSREPEPATFRIHAVDAPRSALVLVSERGVELANSITSSDWFQTIQLPEGPAYVRAQLTDEHGQLLALTNPVWRQAAGSSASAI